MSYRYGASYLDPGLNTLAAPSPQYTYNLYAWGYNPNGSLGLGSITNYSSPKQVGALTNWLSLSTNYSLTLAVKTDGTLWAWGQNTNGALGTGNTTNYSSPKQVGALTNWLSVGAGAYHSLAVKTDGTLWAWGKNSGGQLGFGNITAYSSPKQVGAFTNWSAVFGNVGASYAIKTDGTLWSWGDNASGCLGFGNTTKYSSPKQVGALTNWAKLSSWDSTVGAIKTDGTAWVWGYNGSYGQLGLNNLTNYSSPKQLGALNNWKTISVGLFTMLSVKTDGTLWSWGLNGSGQLGLSNITYTYYSSPKQVGALTNWSNAVGKLYFSMALKTNGTIWTFGQSTYGQLGLGNTTNYSSPKQVGSLTTWTTIAPGPSYGSFALNY